MPDLDSLLAKLYNATKISVVQSGSRSLVMDDHGYIAMVRE